MGILGGYLLQLVGVEGGLHRSVVSRRCRSEYHESSERSRDFNSRTFQFIEIAYDLRDRGSGMLVLWDADPDRSLEEAESSHAARGSICCLQLIPEFFGRRLVLDMTTDLDIKAQSNAALCLGLLLAPLDHFGAVAAIFGGCRSGDCITEQIDHDPASLLLQVGLHQLRPAAVVGAVEDGDQSRQAVAGGHLSWW